MVGAEEAEEAGAGEWLSGTGCSLSFDTTSEHFEPRKVTFTLPSLYSDSMRARYQFSSKDHLHTHMSPRRQVRAGCSAS